MPGYCIYFKSLSNSFSGISSRHLLVFYLPSIIVLLLNIVVFEKIDSNQIHFFISSADPWLANDDTTLRITAMVFLLANTGFVAAQASLTPVRHFRVIKKVNFLRISDAAYLPYFQTIWSHLILISVLCFVILGAMMNLFAPELKQASTLLFNMGFLISGGLAGLLSLKQDRLFLEVASLKTGCIPDTPNNNIQDNSGKIADVGNKLPAPDNDTQDIIDSLQHHLTFDKPYLNSKLGATELAAKLGVGMQKLTHVVNNVMETNFYGLINKHRIVEAKELLAKPENQKYNIETISEMVGFNSKSSFNASFKKMAGQTPSEYRKSNMPG